MLNYLYKILAFFQGSWDKIATTFEQQLKSTTKTAMLFLCIGILATLLFTYYPIYHKIDFDANCSQEIKALQTQLNASKIREVQEYYRGFKEGERAKLEAINQLNELINNLKKSNE